MNDLCRPKRPTRAERSRQRTDDRRRRLAAALRENLKRRKEQERARLDAECAPLDPGDPSGETRH